MLEMAECGYGIGNSENESKDDEIGDEANAGGQVVGEYFLCNKVANEPWERKH